MPGLIFLVGFLVVATSGAVIEKQSAKKQLAKDQAIVRVTTYYREEGGPKAAFNGARLREGHCAVDPKRIPYGSRVRVGGEELVAVDTGPAVVSRKAARLSGRNGTERNAIVVDRFCETKAKAKEWEKSHPHFLVAEIVPPPQPSRSKPDNPKS